MTENVENKSTERLKVNHLPEALRCQYLNLMGIQTWFDPELKVAMPELVEQDVPDVIKATGQTPKESSDVITEAAHVKLTETNLTDTAVEVKSEQAMPATALSMDDLNQRISQCELCELHTSRQQVVTGEGSVSAKIFIITDAPIDDVVGDNALLSVSHKSMLQAMLRTINCSLSDVFVSSLVKCKPPEQRSPQTSEMICCDDHLSAQIKLVQPKVILVLGELASQQLLVSQKSLTDLRLRQHKHLDIPIYASYHPVSMFNSSETKRKVWADLLQISNHLQ